MDNQRKWELASGRRVENIIHGACKAMESNILNSSPAELFIHDTSDPVVKGWFSKDEWNKIISKLFPLPAVDETLVYSFKRFYSFVTTTALRKALKSAFLEAPDYPHIQDHPESWYGFNIWSDILDASLIDLQGPTVERNRAMCRATAEFHNLVERNHGRVKVRPFHNGIIRSFENDYHEYGGIEDGPSFGGCVREREWLVDNFKLLKSLRDMIKRLDKLVQNNPHVRQRMQVVRISTAGLAMQYAYLGHSPVGYVYLLQRGEIMHVTTSIEGFPNILPMLVKVARVKELIRVSLEAVQKRDLTKSMESFYRGLFDGNAMASGTELVSGAASP
ncbi:hypothetical protein HOY82DRAFT_606095 [Tuber indicum]|nr:hypothetical protein HOY82DRAFT_606095 [Tuber indicum]